MAGVSATPYFTPTSIDGCIQWLDASDSSTIYSTYPGTLAASAANVTYWKDKSTAGNNVFQNGSTTIPTYTSVSNALNFAGGGRLWNNTGYALSSNLSFFAVIISPGTGWGTWGTLWGHFRTNYHDSDIQFRQESITTGYVSWHSEQNGDYSAIPSAGTKAMYSCTMSNSVNMFLQASHSGSTNSYTYTENAARIAGGSTANFWIGSSDYNEVYNGYICEIVYYNQKLSDTNRKKVEAYLAQKWGLTSSMPRDHDAVRTVAYRSIIPAPVKITPYTSVTYTFAPTQISNCQLWLDSYDPLGTGTAPSYGAIFTTLADKSGNSRNFSVNSGNTYYCNYESRPSIFISNSIMYASNAVNLTSYTVFIVCQSSNYADNQTTFVAMTGAANCNDYNSLDAFGFYVDAVNNRNRFYGSINTNVVYNSFTQVGANYYPLSQTCYSSTSAGSVLSYANGNVGGSQNSSITRTGTATGFAIGCDYVNDATKFYTTNPKVFINEIIVYNFVLSDTQRRQVEAYLSQKWTLTTFLPTGHTGLTVPYYINQSILRRAVLNIPVSAVLTTGSATGGTITTTNGYRTHTFTTVGSTNFLVTGSLKLQVLIVGGGGGGGFTNCAGGGGAGGAVATILVIPSGTYSVVVGAGGTGGNYTASVLTQATNGNNSSFNEITGIGGGYGGWVGGNPRNGAAGGCGGGGSYAAGVGSGGVGSQGGNGGRGSISPGENNSGGGGGGMGGDGGLPNLVGGFSGGAGGLGATYVIGGTSYTVSGGGGGGTDATAGTGGSGIGGVGGCPSVSSGAAGNGVANTGSGGGGGGGGFANTTGGNGGSGTVIISYVYP